MAKKPLDRAAKEKRQKIILAVGGVLFVGLLAIQGPRTLKMLNAKPPADESHATAPATTDATAAAVGTTPTGPGGIAIPATTPGATATAAAPTAQATAVVTPGGIGIANTTVPATPATGQLVSFSRFKSKDPFVQQVSTDPEAPKQSASASTPATAATPTAPAATSVIPTQAPGGTTSGSSQPQVAVVPTPAAPAEKPTSAQIVVDGVAESVTVRASFPKASPTFTLVSVTKTTARIGIVGGSYSSGGATITLRRGKTVTLENTADGTRYKLRLVSVG